MIDRKPMDLALGRSSVLGALLGFVLVGTAFGQDAEPVEAAQQAGTLEVEVVDLSADGLSQAQQAAGQIEEVIVTAQRSMGALLREGSELTENFYARLNEVISRDEFEINCYNEFPTGSNISTRVCRMRFQEELLSRRSMQTLQGLDSVIDEDGNTQAIPVLNGGVMDIQPEMRRYTNEWEALVIDAVNTDPVLNEQVIRLMALKSAIDNYESPRERRRREREERRALEDN